MYQMCEDGGLGAITLCRPSGLSLLRVSVLRTAPAIARGCAWSGLRSGPMERLSLSSAIQRSFSNENWFAGGPLYKSATS
jgi:hypothetical protein